MSAEDAPSSDDSALTGVLRRWDGSNAASLGEELTALTAKHAVLREAPGKWLVGMLTFEVLREHHFPARMLDLVATGVTPEDAVRFVVEFAQAPTTELLSIQAVHGIKLSTKVRLSERLELVPADDLTRSRYRDAFFQMRDGTFVANSDLFAIEPPRACVAIVHRSTIANPIRSGEPASFLPGKFLDSYETAAAAIGMAFVALIADGLPAELGFQYSQSSHPGYPKRDSGILWRSFPTAFGNDAELDAELVKRTFERVKTFQNPTELARIARRLSRARITRDSVDANLDYGIVAESILTHDERASGEIGYRLATRAGLLLGNDRPTREHNAKLMRKLYGARSAAAHQGRLPDKWSKEDRAQCDTLCTALIQTMLCRGAFVSDWDGLAFGEGQR